LKAKTTLAFVIVLPLVSLTTDDLDLSNEEWSKDLNVHLHDKDGAFSKYCGNMENPLT
jgi:hypothetical protein